MKITVDKEDSGRERIGKYLGLIPGLCWEDKIGRLVHDGSAFKILVGRPTGKRPLGRPRHRREDNIRMDFKEIGINMSNCVDSAHDWDYWRALVNAALNLQVP